MHSSMPLTPWHSLSLSGAALSRCSRSRSYRISTSSLFYRKPLCSTSISANLQSLVLVLSHETPLSLSHRRPLPSLQHLSSSRIHLAPSRSLTLHLSWQTPLTWNAFSISPGTKEDLSSEPNDDRRDNRFEIGKGTDQLSQGGTKNTDRARRDNSEHPDDNTSAESACDNLESAYLRKMTLSQRVMTHSIKSLMISFKSIEVVENEVNCGEVDGILIKKMETLNRNGKWTITNRLTGRKPIGSKYVFKVKYKSSGEVERFKAKLLAKEYNHKEGIDYKETLFHVVKIVHVRCLLPLMCLKLTLS
ncbi:ribonuclease H-like domain-containing protein [Tanacetum coccineum]